MHTHIYSRILDYVGEYNSWQDTGEKAKAHRDQLNLSPDTGSEQLWLTKVLATVFTVLIKENACSLHLCCVPVTAPCPPPRPQLACLSVCDLGS